MRGYRISKEKNGYRFELIPRNNNHQPMGISCIYKDIEECKSGLNRFASLIKEKKIKDELAGILEINRQEDKKFYFKYMEGSKTVFTRSLGYYSKTNCRKAVESIYRNIEEYTTNQKFD